MTNIQCDIGPSKLVTQLIPAIWDTSSEPSSQSVICLAWSLNKKNSWLPSLWYKLIWAEQSFKYQEFFNIGQGATRTYCSVKCQDTCVIVKINWTWVLKWLLYFLEILAFIVTINIALSSVCYFIIPNSRLEHYLSVSYWWDSIESDTISELSDLVRKFKDFLWLKSFSGHV